MPGSVDRKVKPPWKPRKGDKVHIWGFGWVSERTGFILVVVAIIAILIVVANIH